MKFKFFCCCANETVDEAKIANQKKRDAEIEKIQTDIEYTMLLAKKSYFLLDASLQVLVAKTIASAGRINELPIEIAKVLTQVKYDKTHEADLSVLSRGRSNCVS